MTRERLPLREPLLAEASQEVSEDGAEEKPSLALHVCCGPCATSVIERLTKDWDLQAFWYNPNIQPSGEHSSRFEAMRRVARMLDVPLIDLGYEVGDWLRACDGLMHEAEGGVRCDECFRLRLERTACWAARQSIETIATTLSVSPHKPADVINEIGEAEAARHGRAFLTRDFKQENGFQRSVELSKQWGIYRQNYCGCLPSGRG